MQVIICGAGQVGSTIARYLASENNDVTVIDKSPELIDKLSSSLDVKPLLGHASHPHVLEQAGAEDADMLIAVTQSDEVNMVCCQVAHSLFNVTHKIARIRSQDYLQPLWANLYTEENMPVDVIISPEIEMARAVTRRLSVPGAIDVIPLAGGRASLIGVNCNEMCPVVNTPLRQLTNLFPGLSMVVVCIVRDGHAIVPRSDDQMFAGDEIYFVVDTEQVDRAVAAFGHEEPAAQRVLILGGGDIGLFLAKQIEIEYEDVICKIIEKDPKRAEVIASELEKSIVICGDSLETAILQEASIDKTQTVIAVTNDDEVNLLSSLLAKRQGVGRTIALINNPTYNSLIRALGVDAVIDPRAITVSTILQRVRKGRIHAAHTLHDGFGEIIEADALETTPFIGKTAKDIKLPKGVLLGAIVRGNDVMRPDSKIIIEVGDRIILFAAARAVKAVERMFSVGLEFF